MIIKGLKIKLEVSIIYKIFFFEDLGFYKIFFFFVLTLLPSWKRVSGLIESEELFISLDSVRKN